MTWILPRKVPVFDETELARELQYPRNMTLKTCQCCGRKFDLFSWLSLPLIGQPDYGDGPLQMRNCPCRSTLCLPLSEVK